MKRKMTDIIIAIIIFIVGWFFLYLPIMGFAYLFLGEYALGFLYLVPLLCLIGYILYRYFVIEPEKIRKNALSRMYNYPQHLSKEKILNQWHSKFKEVILREIGKCKYPDKKSDLNQCLQVVDKMEKNKIFDKLYRVFRLTGCHMDIKDSNGQTITKIV